MTDIINNKIESALALLRRAGCDYAPAAFASSLGAEDMVLTDLIFTAALPIEVFTLDTGRLPDETYALLEAIASRYGKRLRLVFPRSDAVEDYVASHGVNGFYRSVELRSLCCHIRKVEPLRRALAGKRAWITGMRRAQTVTRADLKVESLDAATGLVKFNPLADWSEGEVWSYIRANAVPYNALHDRGYPSIGCVPCTRPVAPGEDIRAGRWWWESSNSRECGLHVAADGRLARAKETA
jgi:phosphoadenosine phosphosulfate reductase